MSDFYFPGKESAGSCCLMVGSSAVVLDPGMAYMADDMIKMITQIIGDRPVEAILLSHSHYDHVAGLPSFRRKWPDAKVYAADYAASVLEKEGARKTIKKLSADAAAANNTVVPADYDENLLYVDMVVHDGDVLTFGDQTFTVVECVGHTKCSVSYLTGDGLLLACETLGLPNVDESYNPEFLVSWIKARDSIEKCRNLNVREIYLPHHGLYGDPAANGIWTWMENGIEDTRIKLLDILDRCPDEESQTLEMEKLYWHPERKGGWPRSAFDINAQAMLRTIKKEFLITQTS